MTTKTAGQIQEFGGHIEEIAGKKVRDKVMEGSEPIAKSSNKGKVALWMKEAIDRLDACATPEKCKEIMGACGHNCAAHNSRMVDAVRLRRKKFKDEKTFLEAEIKRSAKYTRIELKGKTVVQYYTPHNFTTPRRCFCSLMYSLPEGVNASPTYCQCSRGFVESYWESALGRPVKVEVVETAISGADECKFIIHL
jgi:predicted hydrocarbon binding protein